MRCRGLALLLLGTAVVANAAEPENGAAPKYVDLATVELMQFDTAGLVRPSPYRLSLGIVPIRSANNAFLEPGIGAALRPVPLVERNAVWASNDNRSRLIDSELGLGPLLRLETKGERLELKPRRHSFSVQWHKSFP